MASRQGYSNYRKFKNPDPSTAKYAPIVAAEILEIIEEKIDKSVTRIYRVRTDSVLGIDLRHAVIRGLSYLLNEEIIRINKFEKQNSNDLRNYLRTEVESEAN